jgi:hypothetical protein
MTMKTLLAFLYNNLEFLYLNSRYRITDSSTTGSQTDRASLTVTGSTMTVDLTNDRGKIRFEIAPTKFLNSRTWFRVTTVRQYLDGVDETNSVPSKETAAWLRDNFERVEELFSDGSVTNSCSALDELRHSNAVKWFGPSQPPSS